MALKKTSETVMISEQIDIDPTFSVSEITLPLDILNREVFVVTGVDFQVVTNISLGRITSYGDVRARISNTRPSALQNLSNTNCMAALDFTWASHFTPAGGSPGSEVPNFSGMEQLSGNTPPADMDYIGIVATDNMFLAQDLDGTLGTGNAGTVQVRVYGYRAQADAATYAGLVQSEALSA